MYYETPYSQDHKPDVGLLTGQAVRVIVGEVEYISLPPVGGQLGDGAFGEAYHGYNALRWLNHISNAFIVKMLHPVRPSVQCRVTTVT